MTNPPNTNWIVWNAALQMMERETGVYDDQQLTAALADGALEGRRRHMSSDVAVELGRGFWKPGFHVGVPVSEVFEIYRPGLVEWLSARKSGGGRGGRPPIHDWEAFWIEVAVIANDPDGLPETQSSLIDHFEQWFDDHAGQVPARSEIALKTSRLYARLKSGK